MKKPPKRMLAFYGKGGIGKSTVVSNLSVLFARAGARVLQFGADPKADSSYCIVPGGAVTVMDQWIEKGEQGLAIGDLVMRGRGGVDCIETGGPLPGVGCAGRGLTKAFELLDAFGPLEERYDVVLFDVLADVVCGGFAAPIRDGRASEVYIVTSGETASLLAANNICWSVRRVGRRSDVRLGGLIANLRGLDGEREIIKAFAERINAVIAGFIPRDRAVAAAEQKRMPVVDAAPKSAASRALTGLFEALRRPRPERLRIPIPMDRGELGALFAPRGKAAGLERPARPPPRHGRGRDGGGSGGA